MEVWWTQNQQPQIPQRKILMPKVGNKHYAYTKAGMAKAKKAAKKSGKKLVKKRKR